jgi:hypothetical protein
LSEEQQIPEQRKQPTRATRKALTTTVEAAPAATSVENAELLLGAPPAPLPEQRDNEETRAAEELQR